MVYFSLVWRQINAIHLENSLVAFINSIKTSALIFSIFVSLLSAEVHAKNEECSSEVIALVGKHFRLNELHTSSEKIITEHCKPWPADTTKALALFVYDDNLPKKRLILALVSPKTNAVLSSYSGWMPEEDAVTRVGKGSARLDTAPYVLSKKTRAFGVIFDTTWLPCAVNGGTSQELQLFVSEGKGKHIRPIFENSMPIHYWGRETADCFNPGKTFTRNITVGLSSSASNGFFDLTLTAHESKDIGALRRGGVEKRAFSYAVQYDGKNYDLSPWQKKFDCWSDKTGCRLP